MSAKKDVQTLWEDVRDWLSDATRTAIREAEDLSRRGRLKVEIMNLSRRIEKKLAELGGVVYDRAAREPDTPVVLDSALRQRVQTIDKL
jgi:hypothetical protein